MYEKAGAIASAAAGIGLPGSMWALDHSGWVIPTWVYVTVGTVSVALIVLALILSAHMASNWARSKGFDLRPVRVPLHVAARHAYETLEKLDMLKLVVLETASPEAKLNTFKYLFMVDSETELFGIKPPSTKPRPIPKTELLHDLHPVDGENSQLNHVIPADSPAYIDVTVRRKDLVRVIDSFLAEIQSHARNNP
jgi:hypothetical protein